MWVWVDRMQCKVSMPHGAMVHGLCRDKAVSLSFGLRYITNSIWPMLHAYLLHGYVEAGTLLRSLVQIVTPSRWNVIIWWNFFARLADVKLEASAVWICYKKYQVSNIQLHSLHAVGTWSNQIVLNMKKVVSTLSCVLSFSFSSLLILYFINCSVGRKKTFCRWV